MTDTTSKQPSPQRDSLTRVPVRHVWFHDSYTFVGLDSRYSTISNLLCERQGNENRYVTCEFIPAWQMFEFSFHSLNNNKDEARMRLVPVARVGGWQREDGPR